MAGGRWLELRRADACAVCGTALAVGTEAFWDPGPRTVRCRSCVTAPPDPAPPVTGTAGASARAEEVRRRTAEEERRRALVERRPVLGRVVNFIDGPPTAGASYAKGAVGEEKLGASLDGMVERGVLLLHDRRRPRTAANIDHLAVAANGVWVIDAKRYKGLVEWVDKGGWRRSDLRLVIGGRDQTRLVEGVHKQVADVSRIVGDLGFDVPVHGVLCFVDAEFRLFAKPFGVQGVLVTWGKSLRERLVQPGPLDERQRSAVHRRLAERLPPAATPITP